MMFCAESRFCGSSQGADLLSQTPHSGIDYRAFYDAFSQRVASARALLGRPLTLTDKILAAHCGDLDGTQFEQRGNAMIRLRVDRVAMQDATAQMALLQFMQSGRAQVAVPSTVHCDHLIRAESGARADMLRAVDENAEVYAFLRTACAKHGIGFWRPGSGIIHQVVLENYAFPGGLMIGTDSHTPNAGGLGMLAIGVGGADAAEVMAGLSWEVLHPKVIGVHLTGSLKGWASPKDVITSLCARLTVKGGTNKVVEYFGPGTESISATGKATICNMGAELGATASVFPYDKRMDRYLRATGRVDVAEQGVRTCDHLMADLEVEHNPTRYYDEVVEIDLDELQPYVVGPHSPDRGRFICAFAEEVREHGWPMVISDALIGSCTNSSYEDLSRAAHVAEQGIRAGLKAKAPLLVSPGSERVRQTVVRDALVGVFEQMGARVLANACGPCIGQWKRGGDAPNSIVSSFNRNFPGRNDGNASTHSFITSPEIVVALAFAGRLDFDPTRDALTLPDGTPFHFEPPTGDELPREGFVGGTDGYEAPSAHPESIHVEILPGGDRLQLLEPFAPWDGENFVGLPVLVKTSGKTTTDHISPAGPWLRFRGHLDRISNNMFLGARNAFTDETGHGTHPLTGETGQEFSRIARDLKARGVRWVVIGDENYGEGSSREHAAMSPRYLGCVAVIARSFARIHETNLKKQGILPFTFVGQGHYGYDTIGPNDRISLFRLDSLMPGTDFSAVAKRPNGSKYVILLRHTLTAEQIGWFKAGSALNAANV
jgi:aconitate hydratase